jgi:hypothetical protein
MEHTMISGSYKDPTDAAVTHQWSIPPAAPPPAAECKAADTKIYGNSYAWMGFTFDGTTWSCNTCPGGKAGFQGIWNFTYDPDHVSQWHPDDGKDFIARDLLVVDGNRWTEHQKMSDGAEVTVEGWYFCGSKPEIENETVQFVVTQVTASTADTLDWEVGAVFSADVLVGDQSSNELLWGYYFDVETVNTPGADWNTAPFCRVCETVQGETCPNPYP